MLSRALYRIIKPIYDAHIKKDDLLKLSFEDQVAAISKALRKHPALRRQTEDMAKAAAFLVNVKEGEFEDPASVRELAGFPAKDWPEPQPLSVIEIASRNKEYLRIVTEAMRHVDHSMLCGEDSAEELTMLFRHTAGIGGVEDLGTPSDVKATEDTNTAKLLVEFLRCEIVLQRPEWFADGELQETLPDGADGRSLLEIEAAAELESHLTRRADRKAAEAKRRATKRQELERIEARYREALKVSGALEPILDQLKEADDSKFADCRKVMSEKGWLPQDLGLPEEVPQDFAEQYVLEQLGTELQPEWMMKNKNDSWVFRRGIGFVKKKGPTRVEKFVWRRIDQMVEKYGLKKTAPIARKYLDELDPPEDEDTETPHAPPPALEVEAPPADPNLGMTP